MSTKILSELSQSELQEVLNVRRDGIIDELKEFTQKYLVEIATHYINNTNSLQKRGFIRLIAVEPDSLDADPKYDLARNEKQIIWRFCFIPFDDECVPTDTDFFVNLKLKDPYEMPIIFFEKPTKYYHEGTFYKVNPSVFCLGFTVTLSSHVEEVAEEKVERANTPPKPRQQREKKLEDQLYDWLRVKGVEVERQVTTVKHRLDLWIPNKAMLELKQGRVSGDDVCQAIDYAATYQMPIVLVGSGLSSGASRGIDGFNRAMGKDLIIFVTWGGVKPYLSGTFNLK